MSRGANLGAACLDQAISAVTETAGPTGTDVDVIYSGKLYCDLVFADAELPQPGSEVFAKRFTVAPGGTANRCVASARLGLHTGVAATIGTDMFGAGLIDVLSAVDNLDLRWLRRDPAVQTSLSVAVTNPDDRSFITYEAEAMGCPDEWPGPLPRVRACHLCLAHDLPAWATLMRTAGTLLVGGVGWDASGEWSPTVLARLSEVDVFCPNAVEAMSYTRTDSPEQAAKVLADLVPLVVVTRGGKGALAIDSGTGACAEVPAVPVQVADPTGAGDVFISSFLFALLRDWPLAERLRFASLCASYSVQYLGGASSAPGWPQIRAFLAEQSERDRAGYAMLSTLIEEHAGRH